MHRDIIAIGASAGGLEPLIAIARRLPPSHPVAVFVVVHFPAAGRSALPEILGRASGMEARAATDGEPVEPGTIYVARPDHHLSVRAGVVRVERGATENRQRPAIDVLFRSLATAYGGRVAGIVLSGALDDGTRGLAAIRAAGGETLAQEPEEAVIPSMPASAIAAGVVDRVLTTSAIADHVVALGARPSKPEGAASVSDGQPTIDATPGRDGGDAPSPFGCPDCGGVLWESVEQHLTRFVCRVGHAFTPDGLLHAGHEEMEASLWAALRGMEESAELSARLAHEGAVGGHPRMARYFERRLAHTREHATRIRVVLDQLTPFDTTGRLHGEAAEGPYAE